MTQKTKNNKSPVRKKEFAVNPFKELKGLSGQLQSDAGSKTPPTIMPAEEGTNDSDLFLRTMSDVRKLHSSHETAGKSKSSPAPKAAGLETEDRRLFLDTLKSMRLDVTFHDNPPENNGDSVPGPVNRLRQLKRGAIRIDFQLDLHGLTRDEAVSSLSLFIAGACRRRQKAVLIITGKGNNSSGEPILQGAVTSWLREKGKGIVAEFAPAPRDMGGSG